ncbi:hypothetical protein [Methylobacterium terrae]|uniref:hypothetical protein n=1 Tax=Methylobacterium terrae TaxID=2202827 RepID=UPI0013A593F4|nr:hypothetical protein [Methylobacterium terrae]
MLQATALAVMLLSVFSALFAVLLLVKYFVVGGVFWVAGDHLNDILLVLANNFGTAGPLIFVVLMAASLFTLGAWLGRREDRKQVAETGTLDLRRNVSGMSRVEWWRSAAILATPAVILAVVVAVYLLTKASPT